MDKKYLEDILYLNLSPFSECFFDGLVAKVYSVKQDSYNGVAIEYPDPSIGPGNFDRRFQNSFINIIYKNIDGIDQKLLCFCVNEQKVYDIFIDIAARFLQKAQATKTLDELLSSPHIFSSWITETFGNAVGRPKNILSILGEALVFIEVNSIESSSDELRDFEWEPISDSTIDIKNNSVGIEVKTTKNKYTKSITINGLLQGTQDDYDQSWFVLVGLEKSKAGLISIDSIYEQLNNLCGTEKADEFISKINSHGVYIGDETYHQNYIMNFMHWYINDEQFPKLEKRHFVNQCLPLGVIDIKYKVSLDNLPYFESLTDELPKLNHEADHGQSSYLSHSESILKEISDHLSQKLIDKIRYIFKLFEENNLDLMMAKLRVAVEIMLKWYLCNKNGSVTEEKLETKTSSDLFKKMKTLNCYKEMWYIRLRPGLKESNEAVHDRPQTYDHSTALAAITQLLIVLQQMCKDLGVQE